MPTTDKRVDQYIRNAAPFAKPILTHLRGLVHKTCPQVEETIKWGFPHFVYNGILCSMASFKGHCAFGFYQAKLMGIDELIVNAASESAMGHLGKITSLDDLPADRVLMKYIKEAMKLNEEGVKVVRPKAVVKSAAIPADLKKALAANKKAETVFAAFSPSNKRDYIEWITEAKTETTRTKRLTQAIEWIAEGKPRNWKYMK